MSLPIPADVVYDSGLSRRTVPAILLELTTQRRLLGVLLRRDLVLRHKRSALGVSWSLLNPLLMSAVFWVVFSNLFQFRTGGTQYIVYVLSGTVLVTLFGTAVMSTATSLVEGAPVLARIRAPAAAFALAAAGAALVTGLAGITALLAVQLATGTGIAVDAPLAVVPVGSLVMFAAGLGLALAATAVRFHDVLDLLRILLQVLVYVTPTFYPLAIVPERYVWVIHANPLSHYLEVFREVLYGAGGAGTGSWLVVALLGPVALLAGLALFGRGWEKIAPWL